MTSVSPLAGFAAALCFSIMVSTAAAQQQLPVLTRNITFDALNKLHASRKVEWTNPNGSNETMSFIEMPIPVSAEIKDLTLQFVKANYHLDSIWLSPKVIVFHSMDLGGLKPSLEYSSFLNDRLPDSWGLLAKAGNLPNGAHFIIAKDGTIVCLTPPVSRDGSHISYEKGNHKWMIRRHQDGNPVAIGIENATDTNGDFTDLSDKQIESNAKLARWLVWFENMNIKYIASHDQFDNDDEYQAMLKTFSLVHYQPQYRTVGRMDIGVKNLDRIKNLLELSGLKLRSRFRIE
jgi:hypothetical protein